MIVVAWRWSIAASCSGAPTARKTVEPEETVSENPAFGARCAGGGGGMILADRRRLGQATEAAYVSAAFGIGVIAGRRARRGRAR